MLIALPSITIHANLYLHASCQLSGEDWQHRRDGLRALPHAPHRAGARQAGLAPSRCSLWPLCHHAAVMPALCLILKFLPRLIPPSSMQHLLLLIYLPLPPICLVLPPSFRLQPTTPLPLLLLNTSPPAALPTFLQIYSALTATAYLPASHMGSTGACKQLHTDLRGQDTEHACHGLGFTHCISLRLQIPCTTIPGQPYQNVLSTCCGVNR